LKKKKKNLLLLRKIISILLIVYPLLLLFLLLYHLERDSTRQHNAKLTVRVLLAVNANKQNYLPSGVVITLGTTNWYTLLP